MSHKNKRFFFLVLSAFVHGVIVFFFFGANRLWGFFDTNVIIPSSIRVDMVSLPNSALKQEVRSSPVKKPVLSSQRRKSKPKKKPKPVELPEETKQKKSIKKERKKTDQEKKDPEKQDASLDAKQQKSPSSVVEQNANLEDSFSSNMETSSVENSTEQDEVSFQQLSMLQNYMGVVKRQVKANWNLPKYLATENLTAEIEIKINRYGEMTYTQLVTSSGNHVFDSHVINAIKDAAPYFHPPPEDVRKLLQDGIVLVFP